MPQTQGLPPVLLFPQSPKNCNNLVYWLETGGQRSGTLDKAGPEIKNAQMIKAFQKMELLIKQMNSPKIIET